MGKRFTDSDKWKDKWFRGLSAVEKLAYLYCLDNCDHAGVIEIDEELADFQIGSTVDWIAFFEKCDGRLVKLECGKWWVAKFITYQYGSISEGCKAHNPVFASIEKYGLRKVIDRVSKGYPKGIQRVLDKDKDKDTDKDKDKDKDKDTDKGTDSEGKWAVPTQFDTQEIRDLLCRFTAMRQQIKKPIRDFSDASLILKRFDSIDHLAYALETCISNRYQGLKPDYRPVAPRSVTQATAPRTFAQLSLENSANAIKEFSGG